MSYITSCESFWDSFPGPQCLDDSALIHLPFGTYNFPIITMMSERHGFPDRSTWEAYAAMSLLVALGTKWVLVRGCNIKRFTSHIEIRKKSVTLTYPQAQPHCRKEVFSLYWTKLKMNG